MAASSTNVAGIKMHLRRVFSTPGGFVIWNGTTYSSLESLASAVFTGATSGVVVIQTGFEGGYSTGQMNCDYKDFLLIIEELLEETGVYVPTTNRSLMTFADWSGGCATT